MATTNFFDLWIRLDNEWKRWGVTRLKLSELASEANGPSVQCFVDRGGKLFVGPTDWGSEWSRPLAEVLSEHTDEAEAEAAHALAEDLRRIREVAENNAVALFSAIDDAHRRYRERLGKLGILWVGKGKRSGIST